MKPEIKKKKKLGSMICVKYYFHILYFNMYLRKMGINTFLDSILLKAVKYIYLTLYNVKFSIKLLNNLILHQFKRNNLV